MAGDGGSTIQRLIGTVLGLQSLHKLQKTAHHGLVVLAQQPIELSPMQQAGKSPEQVPLGIPVEIPFTGKEVPLCEQWQGDLVKDFSTHQLSGLLSC